MFINFCIARPKYCFILCTPAVWQLWLNEYVVLCYVTCAGWQVTLCDHIWHVGSRSGVATLRTAIQLLLTYLHVYAAAMRLYVELLWPSLAVRISFQVSFEAGECRVKKTGECENEESERQRPLGLLSLSCLRQVGVSLWYSVWKWGLCRLPRSTIRLSIYLVAEWLACWTQAQKGPGSNRSRDAVG